jgi:hypothetical protein
MTTRAVAITTNTLSVVFFIGFLTYTFVAQQHLESLARDFVTEKTIAYSKPAVEVAAEAVESPLAKQFLNEDQEKALRSEIKVYQDDPAAYVRTLTQKGARAPLPAPANPVLAKAARWKEGIRAHYDQTLAALITDLRIFSTSNLVAGAIALVLAVLSAKAIRASLAWFSVLMFVGVLYSSYLYIDDLNFFRILFRSYMGWGYAAFLLVMTVGLFIDYGRQNGSSAQESGSSEKASGTAQ